MAGANVLVHYGRSAQEAESVVDAIRAQGGHANAIQADLGLPDGAALTHHTCCPYKGDAAYYSIPIGGAKSEDSVWTYEEPHEAVESIKEYLAFYPSRVDALEVIL